jgi:uncharacterized protein
MSREDHGSAEEAGPFFVGRRGDGVAARVRIKLGAAQERIRGIVETLEGPALEVSVTARPIDGQANAALIAALAKDWRVPKSALTIISGNKGRIKTILIEGEPTETLPRLTAWLARLSLGKDM